ncbi:MAG: hypothetical protein KKF56_01120 [Nanoarchaeota archaeon]|nr:hypothetical protein [Nanoarchaeota archaeon]
MQVVGFNFEKITAEKKEQATGKIKINSNIKITNITEDKVKSFSIEVLKFGFEFSIEHLSEEDPKKQFGEIVFRGSIILTVDKKQQKEILKDWKSKKIPDSVRNPVYNIILSKANLKALQLEEELGLPTHIQMPKIASDQKDKSYTG